MGMTNGKALVWMSDDLRLEDNLALFTASRPDYNGYAVVRVRPEARGRPLRTPHRIELEDAAEQYLRQGFQTDGIAFEVLDSADDSLAQVCQKHDCRVVIRNAADGTPIEEACRQTQEQELQRLGIPVITLNGENIRRKGPGGEKPLTPFLSDDATIRHADHPIALLRAFLERLPIADYQAGMWIPGRDRASTSQLSTHLAAGTLSIQRAFVETAKAERAWHRANPGQYQTIAGSSFRYFKARLEMRRGFLSGFSRYEERVPPVAPTSEQAVWLTAWREGRTGIPMPDAAMRELTTTGWINFRLRQLVTSYAIQLLGLPPHAVGVVLAELFDDYEPGITWMQVGLNDGAMGKERGPRILNPVKQGHDLDPDETYIRQWIPELATLPIGCGHEPWKQADSPLSPPLVDHKAAFKTARANWKNRESLLRPPTLIEES
jgi:deoxyribodipyrimidine photolyase